VAHVSPEVKVGGVPLPGKGKSFFGTFVHLG